MANSNRNTPRISMARSPPPRIYALKKLATLLNRDQSVFLPDRLDEFEASTASWSSEVSDRVGLQLEMLISPSFHFPGSWWCLSDGQVTDDFHGLG